MYDITKLNAENPTFSTMELTTKEDRKTFYNAVQNPAHKISEFINNKVTIQNVYCEATTFMSDEGVVTDGVRTVIITPDGEGIMASSNGIVKSLRAIFDIFGLPAEWDEPLDVIVRQIETPNGRYFKLEVC